MSALPPKADIDERDWDIRFVPKADILRCGKKSTYSLNSSARPMTVPGMVRPSGLGGLEIDDEVELRRLLERQVGRFGRGVVA
jgi:hypothetical protein